MTFGEIPTGERDRKILRSFNFNPFSRTLIAIAQMVGDGPLLTTLSCLSLTIVTYAHGDTGYINYVAYTVCTTGTIISFMIISASSGVYDVYEVSRFEKLRGTVKSVTIAMLILTAVLFICKVSDNVSRVWLATWSFTSPIALCGFRFYTGSVAQRLRQRGQLTKNVAILGASAVGQQLATRFAEECSGTRLVGIFDEHQSRLVKSGFGNSTRVQQLTALYELLCRGCIDEVVIAIPPHTSHRILELSRRFHPFSVYLRVLALDGYENFRVLDSRQYGDIGTFRVMDKPLDELAALVKHIEDVVIAAICLLITLPLMLAIAVAIKLDSRGPAQLINVLKGEMSLVGPRPHALAASAAGVAYARAISDYPIRHRVKPGITGWAQVNGWRVETKTIEQIRRRVEHDLYYVENWSLGFDLLILGRTVFAVLSRANAI